MPRSTTPAGTPSWNRPARIAASPAGMCRAAPRSAGRAPSPPSPRTRPAAGVADHDAVLRAGRHVDRRGARAGDAQHPQLRQPLDQRARETACARASTARSRNPPAPTRHDPRCRTLARRTSPDARFFSADQSAAPRATPCQSSSTATFVIVHLPPLRQGGRQRLPPCAAPQRYRSRGSSASRSPSPTRLNAQHAQEDRQPRKHRQPRRLRQEALRRVQHRAPGRRRRLLAQPQERQAASAMIALAIASVACTSTGGTMFGSMWRTATRQARIADARAPPRHSRCVAASIVAPRATRMKTGVGGDADRDHRVGQVGPEERRQRDRQDQERAGQHRVDEAADHARRSSRRRTPPAGPTGTPIAGGDQHRDHAGQQAGARAEDHAARARRGRSRRCPSSAAHDGALRIAVQLVAIGSYGAISGASDRDHDEQHDDDQPDHRAGRRRSGAAPAAPGCASGASAMRRAAAAPCALMPRAAAG